jgi:hypothetical protein
VRNTATTTPIEASTTLTTAPALPTTTPAPTTTVAVAPTTVTPTVATTTPPGIAGGWRTVDAYPADIDWSGAPSPALPSTPGQPLPDGHYEAEVDPSWSAANPNSLSIVVHRLDLCSTLPSDACETDDGGEPSPTDLGPDEAHPYPMTVPLDSSIGIGLTGYECQSIQKTGNGADLAALFSAFDAAYNSVIAPLVTAGQQSIDIINAITATPAAGFAGSEATCPPANDIALVFHANDAPPVLLQQVDDPQFDASGNVTATLPLTPTSAVQLGTVVVANGVMTLYWYAGSYS